MSLFYSDDPKAAERRPLLVFLLITLGVGGVASLFTTPEIPTWYARLVRPAIAPPNWVFAPVWTALYILMAFAGWRVWKKTGWRAPEMAMFGVQLALNFAWSVIFFGLHAMRIALIEIAVLNVAILATAIMFFRRDRLAGLLFLPYLGWTLFAAALNQAFWKLNG
jgi:tryptophan-rich sensory protein